MKRFNHVMIATFLISITLVVIILQWNKMHDPIEKDKETSTEATTEVTTEVTTEATTIIENKEIFNENSITSTSEESTKSQLRDVEINKFELNLEENPYQQLFKENADFVGWIKIEDTLIDYPIVKASDNEYYLKRGFDKKYDFYGSIFMDYRNFGIGLDKNTIIYGHNMKDRKMFGDLSNYMEEVFAKEHLIIEVNTLYGDKKYKVFSVYFDKADNTLIQTQFNNTEYESYVKKLVEKSVIPFDVTIKATDNILTLITCSYDVDDGRYYVHAVEF